MSTSNRGSDRSGAASPDAHSELKPPASPAPSLPTQPVVPDAPTVIRSSSPSGPMVKQMTVISGGVPSPITSSVPLSTNELGNLLEEEMLGPLRLDKFIGGGGMGAVFRAHDTNLRRTVAVKILSRGQGAEGELKKRFQLEAQSAARLDHENIARVFYVGEHDGWNYIVFEYIDGINIRDLVHLHGPLSMDDAINYTLQIAEALHHASLREVVHRDIKPSNVLVTPAGRAKLVDMGLARLHRLESGKEELTASGVTLGTFDYISPEQARDPRSADVRSDIYSLGCTLFFMLSGQPPFSEGTVLQKLLSHTSDEPPDIGQYRADIPAELGVVLRKMLAKIPNQRQQTASQLIGELLLVAEKFGLPSAERSGTVWVTPAATTLSFWERHVPWVASILLLVVTVFGFDYLVPSPDVTPARPQLGISRSRQGSAKLARTSEAAKHAAQLAEKDGPEAPGPGTSGVREQATNAATDATPDRNGSQKIREPGNSPGFSSNGPNEQAPVVSNDTSDDGDTDNGSDSQGLSDGPFDRNEPRGNRSTGSPEKETPREVASSEPLQGRRPFAGQPSMIVVGFNDGERQSDTMCFADLAAALNYLRADPKHSVRLDVIELRFSGRQAGGQRPVDVHVPRVTIRAGDGYQPILDFHPTDFDRTSMFTLHDTELSLQGIHCEVDLPYPVDQWSLFSLHGRSRLSLRDSTLTMRNSDRGRHAFYENAAFFQLAPGRDLIATRLEDPNGQDSRAVSIDLENCVVRGEATVLWTVDACPVRMSWKNGFLATTDRLLDVTIQKNSTPGVPWIKLSLSQVTAVMDRGLCHLVDGGDDSSSICVEIDCDNSTLLTAANDPLIRQRTSGFHDPSARRVLFEGVKNVFLTIAGGEIRLPYFVHESSTETGQFLTYDFQQWCHTFTDSSETWKELSISPYLLPAPVRPAHSLAPSDYAWEQLLTAGGARNHNLSEGVQADLLPRLPTSLPADTPARAEPTGNLQ